MAYVSIDGFNLHYREAGSGPVALFVHGFPVDGRMWMHQLEALSRIRRCIAVDLRGFGRSTFDGPGLLTMEQHADDVIALAAALGDRRVDVIGLSMGGYVAFALWQRRPDMVRSLALVDTRSQADTEEGRAGRDASAARLVAVGKEAWGGAMIEALIAKPDSIEVKARLRSMIESTPYHTIISALEGMKARPDSTHLLGSIRVPVLVIVGERDELAPPDEAQAMADAIPGASLATIPRAGHMAPLEQPGAVNAVLASFFAERDQSITGGGEPAPFGPATERWP